MTRDLALDALFHPFQTGLLPWPTGGGVLFLRAREGAALHARGVRGLVATQPFKPEAERLQRIGAELVDEDQLPAATFPLVLVLPPRQSEEARALLARACEAVAPDGLVEAFRHEGPGFLLGVQWHPEWRVTENPFYLGIFKAFGDACRGRAARRNH